MCSGFNFQSVDNHGYREKREWYVNSKGRGSIPRMVTDTLYTP